MRVAKISTVFALSSVTILTRALPLAPREPQRTQAHFKRVPYSVVAVDGSSPSSASVETVTQASEATQTVTATLAPSILTIVATVTVSGPESEKTVFVTPTAPRMSTGPVSLSSKSSLNPSQAAEITESVVPLPVSISLSSTSSITSTSSPSPPPSSISPPYGPFPTSPLTTSATRSPQCLSTSQPAISTISVSTLPAATRTLPEASNSLTTFSTWSSTTSFNSPSPTASELSQTSSPAQLLLPTVSLLAVSNSAPAPLSPSITPSNTSSAASPPQTTPTTTYDDGSWHTSYPALTPTSSSLSISTSKFSIDDPSPSSVIEKYAAATMTPSTTRQSALPPGGVPSGDNGAYSGASPKSWNGTVV